MGCLINHNFWMTSDNPQGPLGCCWPHNLHNGRPPCRLPPLLTTFSGCRPTSTQSMRQIRPCATGMVDGWHTVFSTPSSQRLRILTNPTKPPDNPPELLPHYLGGGGDPCLGKSESTNSGATKPVPFLKNERTNYAGLAKIAHEKQWTIAVISWWAFLVH